MKLLAIVAATGLAVLAAGCGGSSVSHEPTGDQQKLVLALKTARCMRAHGYAAYPDPPNSNASSQGSGTRFRGSGIDTKSPRFQTMETSCEQQMRKALGLR